MWSLLVNVAVFLGALALGALLVRRFPASRVSEVPGPLTRAEVALAGACVLLNSLVMYCGWWLFRAGWLQVRAEASALRAVADAALLLVVMDLAMYVTHRFAHHPRLFEHIHRVHHRYEKVRPLTLFALHPLEVLGFGSLWLLVLLARPFSLWGMLLYLTANTVFGVVGHVGVEPLSARLRALPIVRAIGTSTFHAQHHQEPRSNYGFYTSLWDRLFHTLDARSR